MLNSVQLRGTACSSFYLCICTTSHCLLYSATYLLRIHFDRGASHCQIDQMIENMTHCWYGNVESQSRFHHRFYWNGILGYIVGGGGIHQESFRIIIIWAHDRVKRPIILYGSSVIAEDADCYTTSPRKSWSLPFIVFLGNLVFFKLRLYSVRYHWN